MRRLFSAAIRSHRCEIGLTLIGAGALVPALFFASWVNKFGVAVPKSDDWDVAQFIYKAHVAQISFADLVSQQQEGRTVLPKIIFALSTIGGSWDVRTLMWLSVLICAATLAGVFVLLRRSGLTLRSVALCGWIASALIFTPAQDEVIGFAYGFPSFLPALFIVAALIILRAACSTTAKFLWCAGLATASSFTLPQGLLAWGLTFPVLLLETPGRLRTKWTIRWIVASAACGACYFWGYVKPGDQPPFAPAAPVSAYATFFFGFLGNGWQRGINDRLTIAVVAGAFLFVAHLLVIAAIWRSRDASLTRAALPWIALADYSIGSATLATLGRLGYATIYCLSSRYVTFSIYVCIANVALVALLLERRSGWTRRDRHALAVALAVILAGGAFLHERIVEKSLEVLRLTAARDRLGRAALYLSSVIDVRAVVQTTLYPRYAPMIGTARILDSRGMLRPPIARSGRIAASNGVKCDDLAAAGYWERTQMLDNGNVRASGWAALPAKSRPADCVVLAYASGNRDWVAFAISREILPRRDVALTFGRAADDELWTGWSADFSPESIPAGTTVSAWALDTDRREFFRLHETAIASHIPEAIEGRVSARSANINTLGRDEMPMEPRVSSH